jgi:hypothetical protein
MRYLSVAWLLPLLLFGQSAEAARISFASGNCGTPPLLGVEFGIDAGGTSVSLDMTVGCPTLFPGDNSVIPGDLVGDGGAPLYGTEINSIDLTITSTQTLALTDFEEPGGFFGLDDSLDFSFTFAPGSGGGGVLSITFSNQIDLPCTPGGIAFLCSNLDLLIRLDEGDSLALASDSIVRVTRVNGFSVPEPTTLALLGIGVAGVAVRRRATAVTRKRLASAPDTADRI